MSLHSEALPEPKSNFRDPTQLTSRPQSKNWAKIGILDGILILDFARRTAHHWTPIGLDLGPIVIGNLAREIQLNHATERAPSTLTSIICIKTYLFV
jgi:hypothetical protein